MKKRNQFVGFALILFVSLYASCSESGRPEMNETPPTTRQETKPEVETPETNISEDSLFTEEDFGDIAIELEKGKTNEGVNLTESKAADLKVKIHNTGDYSAENAAFANNVARHLEIVLNSPQFRDLVEKQKFTEDEGKTPSQILDLINQAREKKELPGNQDGVMDLRLTTTDVKACYRANKPTIGIHFSGSDVIKSCIVYLDRNRKINKKSEVGGHYTHEFLHALGFSHPGKKMTSVPYRIGSIVRILTEQGINLYGTVQADQTFKTSELGKNTKYKVYSSHYGASPLELLDLSKHKGKKIRLHISSFDEDAVYDATILK